MISRHSSSVFRRSVLARLLAISFTPLLALPARADDQPQDDPASLPVITVTAQKRAESLREVPAAVSAIDGKTLTEGGGNLSAGSVMNLIPNASGPTNDGHVRTRWWIRGLGTGDQSANVVLPISFYVDDVYLNSPLLSGAPPFDLERVEVLRGPQGTLWGKNTTGGAISFTTVKPTFTPQGYARVDIGNYDSHIAEGAIGGPLRDDVLAGRVSFYSDHTGGYGRNLYNGSSLDKKGDDNILRVQLFANISPDLQILASVHDRDFRGSGDNLQGLGVGPGGTNSYGYVLPALGSKDIAINAPTNDKLENSGASVNIKWLIGENELTAISAYEQAQRTSNGDGDATPLEISRSHGYVSAHQTSQEFRLASPHDREISWIAGLHYFNEGLSADSASAALPGVQTIPTPVGSIAPFYNNTVLHQDTRSYAIFGSATYSVSERLKLTGGLRWTSETKSIDLNRVKNTNTAAFNNLATWWLRRSTASGLTTTAVQDDSRTWKAVTWDITPQYRLSRDVSVYAKVAKGFRGGGYNGGVTTQATVAVVNPEYLTSYETGVRSAWLNNRLTADATIFYYDYQDIQLNQVVATSTGTVSRLTNSAQAKAKGAEFEVVALPADRVRLNLGLGLLDTEYQNYGAYSGNEFGRAPHVNVLVGGEYKHPLEGGDQIVFGTDWNHRSHYYFATNNETDPNQQQNAYTVGNLRASYVTANKKTTITVYANNVTDRFYKTNAIPYGNNVIGYSYSDPRTVGITLVQRW